MLHTQPETPILNPEALALARIGREAVQPDWEKAQEILARIHAMPIYDDRTADEIIGYDEYGLPG